MDLDNPLDRHELCAVDVCGRRVEGAILTCCCYLNATMLSVHFDNSAD